MGHVFTKRWFEALAIRMIKSFAEGALAVIGTGAVYVGDVNWLAVLSGGVVASVVSFLFALKGLPEVGDVLEDEPKE